MYRILLVDDEILVRDAIKENIDWKGIGCELVGDCENGRQAAEFIQENPVDIVLTDILMPYMDGMELSQFLHDNYPDIVIVIFSGFGEFEYAKKAIQYNVSEYLLKPVTAMELTGVIEKMKKKVDEKRKEKKKIEKLKKASESYHKNAQIIRSKAMEALVNCTANVEESLEKLRGMGIELSAVRYRVAMFDIDLYSNMYQLDMEKRQESALMAFVLYNISDEIVTREQAGYAYQEGGNRVCVLFQEKWGRDFIAATREICREIQEKMKEVMGIDVSMGIGDWVKSPDKLLLSHDMAAKAMEYRYLLGGKLLIDMAEHKDIPPVPIDQLLDRFTAALKTGNGEIVEKMVREMKDSIRRGFVEKSRACMYLQQIVRTMDRVCEDVSADMACVQEGRDELLRQITEQKSFDSACRLVEDHIGKVFKILSDMNSSSEEKQARLATDYIQQNYMDPDLSLNDICSYLNISTSYFSTIFKKMTGETFTEVLIRTRMEKAKELLENTTMKNYEIAEKVGFSDPHYFGISFKKMTGVTPTEYAREKRR